MLDFINKSDWITTYKEDFLPRLNHLEQILETNRNDEELEYQFVITFEAAFNVMKKYFSKKGEMLYKKKEILDLAIKENIIQNEKAWNDAIKLTERIGRAVRPKEENIELIESFCKIFIDLSGIFGDILDNSN